MGLLRHAARVFRLLTDSMVFKDDPEHARLRSQSTARNGDVTWAVVPGYYDQVVATRNPPRIPADTTPAVWRHQMAAIAERSVAERLDEWAQLNEAMSLMEADGVRRRHPGYSERQVFLAQVRLRYGDNVMRAAWPDDSLVEP